ncbi:DExH-box splicing factor binding site-domain-containing protein [Zychaea mexicana]|uniref:DExH-box splicing factor binding site-domain-containing protein n=1 Tax=Zychaea mexicana TaxID=64656 RepID=UPI0022FDFB82|nr:DExH-box splicing factor binding site-domain-containing protein [Zychaea mexicana]KAI9496123.1 DExH-box splicing factor binding site-domain-containing protein [Zychaea mexicana]
MSSPSTKLPFQKKGGSRQKFSGGKRFGFGDDDDQEEEDQVSVVTGFDDNKVQELTPKVEEKPLAIAPLPNVDWRAKKKKQLYVPGGQHSTSEIEQEPEVLGQSTQSYGLQVMKKSKSETAEDSRESTAEIRMETENLTVNAREEEAAATAAPKSLEEQALEEVIEGKNDSDEEHPKNTAVIPMVDETEVFREDVKSRPDDATMDDYERMPVDQFGAALLRGLGWKEGEGIGRNRRNAPTPKPFTPIKRQALLGLGAKAEEVGEGKKKPSRRSAYEYKETSLFKKVAKRKIEERAGSDDDRESSDYASSASSTGSRKEHRSSSSSSSTRRRRSRSRERRDRKDRYYSSSSRDRSRDRSRSRERRRHRSRSSEGRRDRSDSSRRNDSSRRSRK